MAKDAQYFLQIKGEEWGGEFVDVASAHEIPNKSILKVVMQEKVRKSLVYC